MPVDVELLRRTPLFQGMTDAAIEAVRSVAAEVDFAPGDALVREGEPGDCFYVLASGRARVVQAGAVIRELEAGDFIGEIALLDGRPRTATVIADEPVRAVGIRREDFLRLFDERPTLRLEVLEALTERIRRDQPRMGD